MVISYLNVAKQMTTKKIKNEKKRLLSKDAVKRKSVRLGENIS